MVMLAILTLSTIVLQLTKQVTQIPLTIQNLHMTLATQQVGTAQVDTRLVVIALVGTATQLLCTTLQRLFTQLLHTQIHTLLLLLTTIIAPTTRAIMTTTR